MVELSCSSLWKYFYLHCLVLVFNLYLEDLFLLCSWECFCCSKKHCGRCIMLDLWLNNFWNKFLSHLCYLSNITIFISKCIFLDDLLSEYFIAFKGRQRNITCTISVLFIFAYCFNLFDIITNRNLLIQFLRILNFNKSFKSNGV